MDNILEKILQEKRGEELIKLNAIHLVNDLFSDLMERERDILTRRFGLDGEKNETLEKIGQMHKLTRERVRQIENASIKKIKRLDNLSEYLQVLKGVINNLLREHGGLIRREFLLDILTVMSLEMSNEMEASHPEYEKQRLIYKNRFDFLLSKLLADDFNLLSDSEHFNASVSFKDQALGHFEDLSKDLLEKLDSLNQTLDTKELLDLIKQLESYQKHQERLVKDKNVDISSVFKSEIFPDQAETINKNKPLYAFMQVVKKLERNKFGHWGKFDWQEIKPKTINDKIYLILKNSGAPLHFTEIASKINDIKFDHKNANPATVHNELILDERYILTGRGMYGLREWQKA